MTVYDTGNTKKTIIVKAFDAGFRPNIDVTSKIDQIYINLRVRNQYTTRVTYIDGRSPVIPLEFLLSGDYALCVAVQGRDSRGFPYTVNSCCFEFRIDTKKCCTSYEFKEKSTLYINNENKIFGKIQSYNALIYSSIYGITINYKKKRGNWRRAKANNLTILIKGYLFEFIGCNEQRDFYKYNNVPNKKKSVAKRELSFYKKISGEDPNKVITSDHRAESNYGFQLNIPDCSIVRRYILS